MSENSTKTPIGKIDGQFSVNTHPDDGQPTVNEELLTTEPEPVNKSPYIKTEQVTDDDISELTENALHIPPTNAANLLEALSNLDEEASARIATSDSKLALLSMIASTDISSEFDVLDNIVKPGEDKYTNQPELNGVSLSAKEVSVKKSSNDDAISAMFADEVKTGRMIHVPLYHSGFWVTLRHPELSTLANLKARIADNEIELGKSTSSMIYSHYRSVLHKIVIDFIVAHISATSVELKTGFDIRTLIVHRDLDILIANSASTMFPVGFDFTQACANTTKLDKKGNPKCSHVISGSADPLNMIYVNTDDIPENTKHILMSKKPNSVSVGDVRYYQESLPANASKDLIIKSTSGREIPMELRTPMLSDLIEDGDLWIDSVISNIDKALSAGGNETLINNAINTIASTVTLGSYNTFINKVILPKTGEEFSDRKHVLKIINHFTSDKDLYESFISGIKDYIASNTMAIVGIEEYICPVCENKDLKDGMQSEEKYEGFHNFIPLDTLSYFFALRDRKLSLVI